MRNSVMQKETIEMYRSRFTQENRLGMNGKGGSECIVFCKRVSPNIFDIKDGFAIVSGVEECFNDGVCIISNSTKVVFVMDRAQDRR